MAVVELTLTEKRAFEASQTITVPAGESELTIKFPGAVPATKKATVRVRIDAILEDAEA